MEISTETGEGRSATLMVHLLGRCNLTCLHCYMEGAPTREEQLPLPLVLRAISECPALGIGSLYLTGGEPLLYRGLKDILQRAAQIPKLEITVCTNATLLSPRKVNQLQEARAKVNISIDGDADFHDRFRNVTGSFRATEGGIQRAVNAGLPVTIIATISKGNLRLLPWMVEWAAAAGAVQFRAQPLLRLGRGTGISDQCLSKQEMDRLLLQLTDFANTYRPRGLKCNLVGASRNFLLKHPCGAYVCNGAGCHRRVQQEIKKVVIREDGTILPEVTNLNHEYAIGALSGGRLAAQLNRYFEQGYAQFDQLCRSVYAEILPGWPSEFVPWDQIVAERSYSQRPSALVSIAAAACGSCGSPRESDCASSACAS